jgi:septation ring formation regulator
VDNIIIVIIISLIVIGIISFYFINQKLTKNKYLNKIAELESKKDQILNLPISHELARLALIKKNKELEKKYKAWKEEHKKFKAQELDDLISHILDLDVLLDNKKYKELDEKIIEIDKEIEEVFEHGKELLEKIQKVTISEESNRNIITNLKARFRELKDRYAKTENNYEDIKKVLIAHIENIASGFEKFEAILDANDYDKAEEVVGALEAGIDLFEGLLDEVPQILTMAKIIIPRNLAIIESEYEKLLNAGFNLKHLEIEKNLEKSRKTVKQVLDKLNILDIEDSTVELKAIIDYCEIVMGEFTREQEAKASFLKDIGNLDYTVEEIKDIIKELEQQIDRIKTNYDFSEENSERLANLLDEKEVLFKEYESLKRHYKGGKKPYSDLNERLINLLTNAFNIKENIRKLLENLYSLSEDEKRAQQQVEEITKILNNTKRKVIDFRLPIIPTSYYVQLKEAQDAIKEVLNELKKTSISIETLNIRVDTARDLVFKLYNTTNSFVKTAELAERAILYGNRYRSLYANLDTGLTKAEVLFFQGKYKLSLETSINAIEEVEPGIYARLLKLFKTKTL